MSCNISGSRSVLTQPFYQLRESLWRSKQIKFQFVTKSKQVFLSGDVFLWVCWGQTEHYNFYKRVREHPLMTPPYRGGGTKIWQKKWRSWSNRHSSSFRVSGHKNVTVTTASQRAWGRSSRYKDVSVGVKVCQWAQRRASGHGVTVGTRVCSEQEGM